MIPHISEKENLESAVNTNFISAIKELGISSLLKQCGIRKTSRRQKSESSDEKRTAFEIFQFLLLMVFQGCTLYRFLGSKKQDIACSKSTYNRFLNDCHYNWRRFITMLAARAVAFFDTLTSGSRFKALVIDDSVISRNRSKRVELLAFIFDHVTGKSVKGFNLLTIGWTDGYSFVPVAFNMLSSAKPGKRLNEMKGSIDKRTNGFKNRVAATMRKTDAAMEMIRSVLNAGIPASYILMDTWFTNEPFIKNVRSVGLDAIGMLKDNKQMYHYKGKLVNLKQIASNYIRFDTPGGIFGSITVRTKKHRIPVKLVFVRNRNKHGEYIIILSTDCSLTDAEIIRRYGYRWSIECCYKVCKSLLKLGKEFQPVNYDTTVSSTALVFTRFIILEWLRRKQNDQKTVCELFFVCCDDIRDIELSDALERLLAIFLDGLAVGTVKIEESVRKELLDWYISQPVFIQKLCRQSMVNAGMVLDSQTLGKMSIVA